MIIKFMLIKCLTQFQSLEYWLNSIEVIDIGKLFKINVDASLHLYGLIKYSLFTALRVGILRIWVRLDWSFFLNLLIKLGVFKFDMLQKGAFSSIWFIAPLRIAFEFSLNLIGSSSGTFFSFGRFPSNIVSELLGSFLNDINFT